MPENSRHVFHPLLHHPIVAISQHVTSPLTASLLIFAVQKSWQAPAAVASIRAARALWAAGDRLAAFPLRATARTLFGASATAAALAWASRTPPPAAAVSRAPPALAALYGERDAPAAAAALIGAHAVAQAEALLRGAQRATGAPWWATIVTVTLALRAVIAPMNLALLRNSLRLKAVLPEVQRLGAALRGGGGADAARELRALFARAGCSPWAQCLAFPLLLPPLVLSVFGALHNLTIAEPALTTGGALWFPDLTLADETQLLPIASGLSWLANVEMGAGLHYAAYPATRLAARCVALATIPLAATLPSGVLIFWITSNLFAVARGAAARTDVLRRALAMPLHREVAALAHLPPWRGV